ncbi:hypothetical protein ACN47E_008426 [Coniothyrium glycines]
MLLPKQCPLAHHQTKHRKLNRLDTFHAEKPDSALSLPQVFCHTFSVGSPAVKPWYLTRQASTFNAAKLGCHVSTRKTSKVRAGHFTFLFILP